MKLRFVCLQFRQLTPASTWQRWGQSPTPLPEDTDEKAYCAALRAEYPNTDWRFAPRA